MNLRSEDSYKHTQTVFCLVHQVLFFMLCEHWFCPGEHLTGLYSLLFYNIFSYIFTNAHRLFSINTYSPVTPESHSTDLRQMTATATKIVLDFTKAMTFVITGVFMFLVFGMDQGLEYFHPTWLYIIITMIYFIITERVCQAKVPSVLAWFQYEYFENHEKQWSPVLLRLISTLMSGVMIMLVWLGTNGEWILIISSSYANIYLTLNEVEAYWKLLLQEKELISQYRLATAGELKEHDDVCPVCLQVMKCARITPCNHIFHGACLERCLKEKVACPCCKHAL